ncbi:nuclear transport factor 2 family protein [Lacinutrix undariae]
MTPKDVVKSFYESDLTDTVRAVETFFDANCILNWHSSKGYVKLDFNGIKTMFEDINKSYNSLRFQISHLLQEDNSVTIRYAAYASLIESPSDEFALAHFMSIFKVEDDKIISGYQMSVLADSTVASLSAF